MRRRVGDRQAVLASELGDGNRLVARPSAADLAVRRAHDLDGLNELVVALLLAVICVSSVPGSGATRDLTAARDLLACRARSVASEMSSVPKKSTRYGGCPGAASEKRRRPEAAAARARSSSAMLENGWWVIPEIYYPYQIVCLCKDHFMVCTN